MMKIELTEDDIGQLDIESVSLTPDAAVKLRIHVLVETAIKEAVSGSWLYNEIRRQVDEFLRERMPTAIGNYVRTVDHTASKIISDTVKKEIENGLRYGIQAYAKKQSEKIVKILSESS